MSTRTTIRYREAEADKVGFHVFGDYAFDNRTDVGVELEGVHVEVMTCENSPGALVSLRLPRELAIALGLLTPDVTL